VRLDEVVLRTLEQKPELRYQQVSEVRTRIDSIAGEPAPAASVEPPQPAWREEPVESRRSRMAVIGGLAVPGALVLGVLGILVFRLLMPENAPAALISILSLALVGGVVIGFALSLISWIRIGSSGGRLTGLGFAITGTILPVVLGVLLVPLVFFFAMVQVEAPPEPTMTSQLFGEDGEVGLGERAASWPEVPPPLAAPAPIHGIEVSGGTAADRAQAAMFVPLRVAKLTECLENGHVHGVDLLELYGEDAEHLVGESSDLRDRELLRAQNKAGLPLYALKKLPVRFHNYEIVAIHLSPDGETAVITAKAAPDHILRFGMVRKQGTWWFAFSEVSEE
jgi:hypothetical protein